MAYGTDSGAAHCYRHPGRETLIRCTRCERPICPECMHPAAVGFHCPDDVAQGRRDVRRERTTVGALLRQSPPYVTISLLAGNIAVYAATAVQAHSVFRPSDYSALFRSWQLQPAAVHRFDDYYRLLSSAFLHINLLHIAVNMLSLVFVGPALERLLGPARFATLYLLGALGGSAAVYAFDNQYTAVAGASGALFGLLAACLVLVRRLGIDPQWLVGNIVVNFVLTFSVANISKLGHIGGFMAGILAAVAIAGPPNHLRRLSAGAQAAGLAGVAVLVVAVIAVRTLTW